LAFGTDNWSLLAAGCATEQEVSFIHAANFKEACNLLSLGRIFIGVMPEFPIVRQMILESKTAHLENTVHLSLQKDVLWNKSAGHACRFAPELTMITTLS
jgi:hypothetical protein